MTLLSQRAAGIAALASATLIVAACGGSVDAVPASPSVDASPTSPNAPDAQSTATDASVFACGSTFCAASELCVYPPCGCVAEMEAPTDAGVCPDGSTFDRAIGDCVVDFTCQPPSCQSPDPVNGTFCSGQEGTLSGPVYGPVPAGMSHDCHGNCV